MYDATERDAGIRTLVSRSRALHAVISAGTKFIFGSSVVKPSAEMIKYLKAKTQNSQGKQTEKQDITQGDASTAK